MKVIPLSGGLVTIVDDIDYDLMSKFKWSAENAKSGLTYAVRAVKGKRIKMHREILKLPASIETDHINGDGLDNRRSNLRPATHHQNSMNVPKKSRGKSKFKGVSWKAERGLWRATINFGRQIFLGHFHNELEAANAYNEAAKRYYGEFAWLNPI